MAKKGDTEARRERKKNRGRKTAIVFGIIAAIAAAIVLPQIPRLKYSKVYSDDSRSGVIGYSVSLGGNSEWARNIRIPASHFGKPVVELADEAFSEGWNLKTVTIPEGVKRIGDKAFHLCVHLEEVNLPDGLTSIGSKAFNDCTRLRSVSMPDSLESIGSEAFYLCRELSSFTVPAGLKSMGDNVFGFCKNLSSIDVSPENTCFTSVDGVLFSRDMKTLIQYPKGKTGSTYDIPDSVTHIGAAFFDCLLESITVPGSVTSIGDKAFCYCDDIKEITIPDSVTSIGAEAFAGCCMDRIVIPESVKSIGAMAFKECDGIRSITIPAGVESIGEDAFGFCRELASIQVAPENDHYLSAEGVLFNIEKTELLQYPAARMKRAYRIPSGVEYIASGCFSRCCELEYVYIPESVRIIGDHAFFLCRNIKEIIIPEGVTTISDGAFFGCDRLSRVVISEGVAAIGEEAFGSCESLAEITVPESVKSISHQAFDTEYSGGKTVIHAPHLFWKYGYFPTESEKWPLREEEPEQEEQQNMKYTLFSCDWIY